MALNDIYQVRFNTYFGPQVSINVRHYLVGGETGAAATLLEIATALDATFRVLFVPLMANQARWHGTGVKKIRPLPEGQEVAFTGADQPGSLVTDPLPKQVCGLIRLRTALAGRRRRGRLYTPFHAEGDNGNDGLPTAGFITAATALANALKNQQVVVGAGGSSTLNPVIYHRDLFTTDAVVTTDVRPAWATQRRRGAFGQVNALPF